MLFFCIQCFFVFVVKKYNQPYPHFLSQMDDNAVEEAKWRTRANLMTGVISSSNIYYEIEIFSSSGVISKIPVDLFI